ncbi:hypothetical protein [Guptibacillus spartinae]|uniref:hypothetical protein n=1 Tax=Guptibacillus spartinae TaxID=3025679 RepID=UPI00235F5300|nr:hypothetical protein [Pseudalkalibacillus spartinae]
MKLFKKIFGKKQARIEELEELLNKKSIENKVLIEENQELKVANEDLDVALWHIHNDKKVEIENEEVNDYNKKYNQTCSCGKGILGPLDDGNPSLGLYCMQCNRIAS